VIWHLVVLLKLKQIANGGGKFKTSADSKNIVQATRCDLKAAEAIFQSLESSGDGEITDEESGELFVNKAEVFHLNLTSSCAFTKGNLAICLLEQLLK
jgi:hypothetical protein